MRLFGVSLSGFTIINEGRSANEDLRVEKGSMSNLALEASAFKHRLNTQVDVWYQRTFDAYTASAGVYPTVYGAYDARMAITNDGIMNCQGIEVETSWADRIGGFEYAVLGQFSYLDQKMVYTIEYDYIDCLDYYSWKRSYSLLISNYKQNAKRKTN